MAHPLSQLRTPLEAQLAQGRQRREVPNPGPGHGVVAFAEKRLQVRRGRHRGQRVVVHARALADVHDRHSRAARELQPQPAARERVAPGEVDPREARRDVAERGEKRVGDDVRVEAARVGEEASFEASERVHGELVRAREHVEDALREVRGEALEVEGRTRRRGGIPRVVRRAFADGSRHRFRGETQE